jgi:NADH-quinone oxidoreductase subunit D
MEEMRQSLAIMKQAIDRMPAGPVRVEDFKVALPRRTKRKQSMEELIHHFKLTTEGFSVPEGSV